MIHQYNPQRFRHLYPPKAIQCGKSVTYVPDARDKRIGTVAVGTILYIQDGVNPLRGVTRSAVYREPWIVEAWLPRDYTKWDANTRTFSTTRIAGGHLAVVRSLRDRRCVREVADWILLACVDAGLEKLS